jgi:hypothetical protein
MGQQFIHECDNLKLKVHMPSRSGPTLEIRPGFGGRATAPLSPWKSEKAVDNY